MILNSLQLSQSNDSYEVVELQWNDLLHRSVIYEFLSDQARATVIHMLEAQLIRRKEALAKIRRYDFSVDGFFSTWLCRILEVVSGHQQHVFMYEEVCLACNRKVTSDVFCMMHRKRAEARAMLQEFSVTL